LLLLLLLLEAAGAISLPIVQHTADDYGTVDERALGAPVAVTAITAV
jgi:hypothetical protein